MVIQSDGAILRRLGRSVDSTHVRAALLTNRRYSALRLLELTLATPAENLALDEALLDEAEEAGVPLETLRLWEPDQPMIVVGRSSKIAEEVRVEVAEADGVPVLRRPSGGASIVSGPGCLMYSLVLSYEQRPVLRAVDLAHRFVLDTLARALRERVPEVACRGTSDLAMGQRKFSGNSVRCKRTHLLYHGTLMYRFPLETIGRWLAMPPHQPVYRVGRSHADFVANLPLDASTLRGLLISAWQAQATNPNWPATRTADLVMSKYGRADWNG